MVDATQLEGAYAASWLPWIMIPMITYILPFPIFAIAFLWIEREGGEGGIGTDVMGSKAMGNDVIGRDTTS